MAADMGELKSQWNRVDSGFNLEEDVPVWTRSFTGRVEASRLMELNPFEQACTVYIDGEGVVNVV